MVMIRVFSLAALATILICPFLAGQSEPLDAIALKIDTPVTVDGVLDEKPWSRALEANDLLTAPIDRRDPSQVQTSVKVLFDETFLYLGFECRDARPELLFAQSTARDGDIRGGEAVFALLEAVGDEDHFYFYGTNLLGAALDGRIGKNGQGFDLRWDGTWRNACRRNDRGWTAELAIDLRNLRFEPGKDRTVHIALARIVPRLDRSFWSEPLDPAFRVSEIKRLNAVPLIQSESRGEWTAFARSSFEEGESGLFSSGIDAAHVFSRNIRGRAVLNPDFLTTTPDFERVNLTRYELYLPERRSFFAETGSRENDFLPLFYSKRIGDIWGGLRVSGRAQGWEYFGMSAFSKRDSALDLDPAFYAVGRLRRSWAYAGSIEFTAANRLQEGSNTGTAGLCGALRFNPTLSLAGQAALSYGPDGPNSYAFALRPSYDTEMFHLDIAYLQIGERFGDQANAVAYIKDDNRRELRTGLIQRIPIKSGILRMLSLDAQGGIAWGMNGTVRSWDASGGLNLELIRKFTIGLHHIRDYKLFEKDFRNRMTRIDVDFNRAERWQSVGLSVTFGRNFDSTFDLFELRKSLLITRDLTFEYDLQRLKLRREVIAVDYRFRETFIHVLRLNNRFNRTMALDVFIQANSAIKKTSAQVYFVFKLGGPFGTVTAGFLQGNAPFGVKGTQGGTFLMKLAPSL